MYHGKIYLCSTGQRRNPRKTGRNAGKGGKKFCKVTIAGNGKTADATRLMAIMAMGIKKGMEVEVTVEGENEEAAAAKMEEFFKANL